MTFNYDPALTAFAVDLGGTSVKIGIVNGTGDILTEESIPTLGYEGPVRVIERIAECANKLRQQANVSPGGVGFGCPGLIDMKQGITRFSPNLGPQWNDFPVRDTLQPLLNCPVRLINDAKAATLGELSFGHGRGGRETMVFYTIGTGLGGGIVIDGKLRLGQLGCAGELGHVIVHPGGRRCGCGNHGCLETYVSGPALAAAGVRLLRSGQAPILWDIVQGDAGKVEAKTMATAAEKGDQAVRDAINEMADNLAIGISAMIHAVHPELIIVGGGVSNLGDLLFVPLREKVAEYVTIFPMTGIRIIPSTLGDRAGLLGAGALGLWEDALD